MLLEELAKVDAVNVFHVHVQHILGLKAAIARKQPVAIALPSASASPSMDLPNLCPDPILLPNPLPPSPSPPLFPKAAANLS